MSTTTWLQFVEDIRRAFETGTAFTVFGGPGPIARLPDALGGDPAQWASLKANADKGTASKLALLYAKAHFLFLPKTMIDFLRGGAENRRVAISETVVPDVHAAVDEHYVGWRWADLLLPGASEYLAKVGYELARVATAVPVGYDMLAICYHEMTHALLWLQEFADADVQKLYNDGLNAYGSAKGVSGAALDPRLAFSEASSSYVEGRIVRWCTALSGLDRLMRARPADTDLQTKLQSIANAYDNFVPTPAEVKGETIASPDLSTTLRDALDTKVLDGRPLTKPFADTPLAGLLTP